MKNKKIQILRAILAIMVVLIHTLPNELWIKSILRPFLNIAVAGFIFLSGYLTRMPVDAKQLYKKRIPTVLIPYVVFTIFYTLISVKAVNVGVFLLKLGKNLATTEAKATLYYLVVYIQLVLLTPLLLKIAKQKSKILNVVILLIQPLFMGCFYFGVTDGVIKAEAPWYIMFFPVWLGYYYMGILIGNGLIRVRIKNKSLVIAAIISLILQILEGIFWLNNTAMKDMYFTQIRFTALLENIPLLILMARYIKSPQERTNKLLEKIGDASFGIYLIHPFFIMICNKFINRSIFTFLIVFAITFLCSYFTVYIANKILPKKILKYTGFLMK